jgi:hypothetical protein
MMMIDGVLFERCSGRRVRDMNMYTIDRYKNIKYAEMRIVVCVCVCVCVFGLLVFGCWLSEDGAKKSRPKHCVRQR